MTTALQIINQNGKLVANSRQVAEMVDRPHNDLMKTIRGYIEYLRQGDFAHSDFFVESTYVNSQNKEQPCYLLTRKGCDMVANKMTGEKGVLFTATYVTKFEEMEKTLNLQIPQTLPEALRLAADLAEKNQNLLLLSAQKEQIISELKPKATYYDLILQNKSLLAVSKIAKDYGMSATALNKILAEEKVQYKQGECWLLYQKYSGMGYTQSKTHAVDDTKSRLHTYWTQKGRLFIYDLLKNKRDILPIIERQIAS
ncbi:MAG: phage antirepressor KilAC domain-containing protein [Thermincolia bacterium]